MEYEIKANRPVHLVNHSRVLRGGETLTVEELTSEDERAKELGLVTITEVETPVTEEVTTTVEEAQEPEEREPIAEEELPSATYTESQLGDMLKSEVQEVAIDMGLASSGTKAELMERILEAQ